MGFIITALKIVIILGFLVLIHETGHFLVARLCKIKVNEFSIGFGPLIWKKETEKTKYAIRLIPLGGYVSMLGEEERSDEEGSFSKASIPKRFAIVVAGALVNILFGILAVIVLIMLAVLAFTRNMSRIGILPIIAIIVVLFLIVLGRAIG